MSLTTVGLSHHTAPLAVRERLTWPRHELPDVLDGLLSVGGTGAVLLSTCNRTEFYLTDADPAVLDALWRTAGQRLGRPLTPYAYVHRDRAVVGHLFRVTSGLDSMVLGESEIQGQVRQAYDAAVGAAGPVLTRLFQAALHTGGRVRGETQIGQGPASVPRACVDLARKIFGELAGRRALVLGSGEMAELAMAALVTEGVRTVMVAHRTFDRAQEVASRLGGRAVGYEEAWAMFAEADIVVCSTAAPHPIVLLDRVAEHIGRRGGRPLCVLDIAVPRDVDPEVRGLAQVFLYDLDDLQGVVAASVGGRKREVPVAERIVDEEAHEFWEWYAARGVAEAIRAFRDRMDDIRSEEVARMARHFRHLSEEDRAKVEHLSRSLMNKFLHEPTLTLKAAVREGKDGALTDAIERLFGLRAMPKDNDHSQG